MRLTNNKTTNEFFAAAAIVILDVIAVAVVFADLTIWRP